MPFARLAVEQPWHRWHRYQHIYMWPLYGFLTVQWFLFSDFGNLATRRVGSQPLRTKPRRRDVAMLIAGKLVHLSWAVLIPLMLHRWWTVVAFYFAVSWLVGFALAVFFQVAHCVDTVEFAEEHTPRRGDDFAHHQLRTTADVACDTPLIGASLAWLMGGLNRQIEHHLAPGTPHTAYRAMSARVRLQCSADGVAYRVHRNMWTALRSHARWLRLMGRPVVEPRPPARAAAGPPGLIARYRREKLLVGEEVVTEGAEVGERLAPVPLRAAPLDRFSYSGREPRSTFIDRRHRAHTVAKVATAGNMVALLPRLIELRRARCAVVLAARRHDQPHRCRLTCVDARSPVVPSSPRGRRCGLCHRSRRPRRVLQRRQHEVLDTAVGRGHDGCGHLDHRRAPGGAHARHAHPAARPAERRRHGTAARRAGGDRRHQRRRRHRRRQGGRRPGRPAARHRGIQRAAGAHRRRGQRVHRPGRRAATRSASCPGWPAPSSSPVRPRPPSPASLRCRPAGCSSAPRCPTST